MQELTRRAVIDIEYDDALYTIKVTRSRPIAKVSSVQQTSSNSSSENVTARIPDPPQAGELICNLSVDTVLLSSAGGMRQCGNPL